MGKDKKDKSTRKASNAGKGEDAPTAETAGFQLFKGKQSDLDGVFSKGVSSCSTRKLRCR